MRRELEIFVSSRISQGRAFQIVTETSNLRLRCTEEGPSSTLGGRYLRKKNNAYTEQIGIKNQTTLENCPTFWVSNESDYNSKTGYIESWSAVQRRAAPSHRSSRAPKADSTDLHFMCCKVVLETRQCLFQHIGCEQMLYTSVKFSNLKNKI